MNNKICEREPNKLFRPLDADVVQPLHRSGRLSQKNTFDVYNFFRNTLLY